jgi:hypothetical protein
MVLRYDPQVKAAVGIARAAPARDLGHESCSHTLPLLVATDVNVVEKRAPLLIVTTVRASKAHDETLLFGEENELIRSRHGQALVPNTYPIQEDGAVKELIAIGAAVRDAPALGVESGDCS